MVPAAQSVDCVSIFARTVAWPRAWSQSAMATMRKIRIRDRDAATGLLARFSFGVPRSAVLGDALSEGGFQRASSRSGAGRHAGRHRLPPLAEAAALLYDSALVAERYVAVRDFFDAMRKR